MTLIQLRDATPDRLLRWEHTLQGRLVLPADPYGIHLKLMDGLLEIAGALHQVRGEIQRRKEAA